jgi:glutamate/tyrosine decarboxylase-like PLP-dependent enzyme
MHARLAADLKAFDAILDGARSMASDYLKGLGERPAAAPLPAQGLGVDMHRDLPVAGMGAKAALRYFHRHYDHLLSASPGPRYFGLVTGGATPAALAADWLVSTYDQNAQLNGDGCAPFIEAQALDMLKQLLGWPNGWTGTCVTGATMANFVGMALARQWVGRGDGHDFAEHGLWGQKPIPVFAGAAHSSTLKAMSMAGMGRRHLTALPLLPGREALDIGALEAALIRLGDAPCIVVASAGTVNTVDFDDLAAIAELKKRYRFWLHVDAAFGGVAGASPDFRELMAGIEWADSVTVDAHKWLNVPYDCAIVFTSHLSLQIEVFKNQSAYLPAPAVVTNNYLHMAPENSRRLRALPLWMSLVAYGQEGFAEIVERNVASARRLGALIEAEPGFRLAAPVRLNVVCFALVDNDPQALLALQKGLIESGVAYVSPSTLGGKPVLRAALCNWRTTDQDIDAMFAMLRQLAMPA